MAKLHVGHVLAGLLVGIGLVAQVRAARAGADLPTGNAVAELYDGPEGYPAWTDAIRWSNVVDMSAYQKGRTDFERFENARDELAAQGGGVLYYPAGTYDFSAGPFDGPHGRGLMLKSGIVIRGERPLKGDRARDGALALRTRFVFGGKPKPGVKAPRASPPAGSFSAGATPAAPAKEGVTHLAPRDWNLIGLSREGVDGVQHVHNVGVAWVHLVRGVIYLGPEYRWFSSWGEAEQRKSETVNKGWLAKIPDGPRPWDPWIGKIREDWRARVPDGTHPLDPWAAARWEYDKYVGSGRGRLVIGCVLEDAAVLLEHDLGSGPESFSTFHQGARVAVYGSRVFIANNVLPASRNNFIYLQRTRPALPTSGNVLRLGPVREAPRRVLWDYGMTCGIDVNKRLAMLDPRYYRYHDVEVAEELMSKDRWGHHRRDDLFRTSKYEPGVVVRDNWVYNHGHNGFNISGMWVTLRDNVNKRDYLKEGDDVYGLGGAGWELTVDGCTEAAAGGNGYVSSTSSCAFDLAGHNLWADGCWFDSVGADPANDGEGILCQHYSGAHWYSWAVTHCTHVRGTGELSYIGGWDVSFYGGLIAWNKCPGKVGAISLRKGLLWDTAFIHDPPANVSHREGGTNGEGKALDVITRGDGAAPDAPEAVRAEIADGDAVRIQWTDRSDNEIGFRIERRRADGPWHTIAYRPRRGVGHEWNPLEWLDVTAPSGVALQYRVVAINERDDDSGAAAPAGPVTLPPPRPASGPEPPVGK